MPDLTAIIADAAAIIELYNPKLAACFRTQPFRRVDLARAFAAGFKTNEFGDLPDFCYLILKAAYADRDSRVALAR
jgi:hypothetical protein